MNHAWVGRVSEVQECEVEQIDDEQDFTDPEATTNPAHDEAKRQKVVLETDRLVLGRGIPRTAICSQR